MSDQFDEWALLELMGHRRLAGRLSEVTLAGGAFFRLDVPGKDGDVATQFYSPSAVYCITPVSEELARAFAKRCQPTPVSRWELPESIEPDRDLDEQRTCRVCGCTEDHACHEGCTWIEPDLCSSCVKDAA